MSITVVLLYLLQVWQPLEYAVYNGMFQLRGALPWDSRIAIIAIDEATLQSLGQFPINRSYYAEILETLNRAQPNVVIFDLLLLDPREGDQKLAIAMNQHGRVVLGSSWNDENGDYLVPRDILAKNAAAVGHIKVDVDTDSISRDFLLEKVSVPSLAFQGLKQYAEIEADVRLPNLQQSYWINWLSPAAAAPIYSFADVLSGETPVQAFKDKIVLVGLTATATDPLQTPFDRTPPTNGVLLHATVISNLLQQNTLQVLGPWEQIALLLVAGTGLGILLLACKVTYQTFIWIGLCILWAIVSFFLFTFGYWVPVASPIVLLALTGGAVTLYERLRMTMLLKQSEERYALAALASNEGLRDWNLLTDEIYLSPRWKSLLGYTDRDLKNNLDAWFSRVHPKDYKNLKVAIDEHFQGESDHLEYEYRIQHRDGTYRWMLSRGLALRDNNGTPYRLAGSQADITERKQVERQLRYNAFNDMLTDLPNRSLFLVRLRRSMSRSQRRPDYLFAVLFLDIDRFKVINDSLGHAAGDHLLVSIARRLKSCLRPGDTVARLGGDEFTFLLEGIRDVSDAIRVADRIHETLAQPFYLDGSTLEPGHIPNSGHLHEIFTAASIGIALGSDEYTQPEELLRDADIAMYRAKALGKARSEVFNVSMHANAMALLEIETDLRRAIEREEFQIYYQPIVCLKTGKLSGFEALVRWQHAKRGLISPGEFIPVAEETGLIRALGWWVLQESCQQLKFWQEQFPDSPHLTVGVNLSGVQCSQVDLLERIEQVLQDTQLPPERLKLEITESVVMDKDEFVLRGLWARLQQLGVRLSIDDFGTGYSSLSRLHQLPINTLKIDRSFVTKITEDKDSNAIIQTIVMLAHSLNLDVVAEGVESLEQIAHLQAQNCEYGQGYFFSEPLGVKAATDLIESKHQWQLNAMSITVDLDEVLDD